jgi:hypothetical protein
MGQMSRRRFLQWTAITGGSLTLGSLVSRGTLMDFSIPVANAQVTFCLEAKPLDPINYNCTANGKRIELDPKSGPKWIGKDGQFLCEWKNLIIETTEDDNTGEKTVSLKADVNAPCTTSALHLFNVYLQFIGKNGPFPRPITFQNVQVMKGATTIALPPQIVSVDVLRAVKLVLTAGQGCWCPS